MGPLNMIFLCFLSSNLQQYLTVSLLKDKTEFFLHFSGKMFWGGFLCVLHALGDKRYI